MSSVRSKLVVAILELEKEFENLDKLNIRSQIKERNSAKKQSTILKTSFTITKWTNQESATFGERRYKK